MCYKIYYCCKFELQLYDPSVCVFMYGQATESRWVLVKQYVTQYVLLNYILWDSTGLKYSTHCAQVQYTVLKYSTKYNKVQQSTITMTQYTQCTCKHMCTYRHQHYHLQTLVIDTSLSSISHVMGVGQTRMDHGSYPVVPSWNSTYRTNFFLFI